MTDSGRTVVFDLDDCVVEIYEENTRIDYDAQSAVFTVGATLTGGSSAATGVIATDSVPGIGSGYLTLTSVTGTFQDNETITDDNGTPGSATSNIPDGTVEGEQSTQLSTDWLYVKQARLSDRYQNIQSTQMGTLGRRVTTIGHDYKLSLGRLHTKYGDDFGLAIIDNKRYRIKLVFTDFQSQNTETYTLKHCVPDARGLSGGGPNSVTREWFVGDYTVS